MYSTSEPLGAPSGKVSREAGRDGARESAKPSLGVLTVCSEVNISVAPHAESCGNRAKQTYNKQIKAPLWNNGAKEQLHGRFRRHGNRRNQFLGVWMLGASENFFGGTRLNHLSVLHHRDRITNGSDGRKFV